MIFTPGLTSGKMIDRNPKGIPAARDGFGKNGIALSGDIMGNAGGMSMNNSLPKISPLR